MFGSWEAIPPTHYETSKRPAGGEEEERTLFAMDRSLAACGDSHHRTGPLIHGANSASPTPATSLLVLLPDATARISSRM